ncbi:hypothetical protein GCM10011351_15550 [Paraliobacillus quinghaiensis]|uniref:DUF4350 domain-containing protein n=1 Tax=Paraliobacillus quinghaiensis TaxID=470815 RepID=A0A917TNF1_9BACI|nr:DUF4350 domain-containing protein [Paraliobacillus quinghaiensis]GGM30302.1 hypothetical protein GCM10011351_15550 [Paraliobacillus quinghaiensis]
MSQALKQKRTWIWLVSLVFLFTAFSIVLFEEEPAEYPAYVSHSPAPMGTKAFYQFLEKEYTDVERWESMSRSLPTNEENGLLMMIEPPLFSEEATQEAYQRYMEAGNTIVLLKRNPDGMFDLNTTFAEAINEQAIILDGIGNYQASVQSSQRLVTKEKDEVLLVDESDDPIAIKRNFGDGQLIVMTEPDWLTNQMILEHDHLAIALSLIDFSHYSSIKFDAYTYETAGTLSAFSVYPKWLLVATLQLFILSLLWLLLKGKRFGPVVEPREATVRFSDERLKALGLWYLKGKNYQDAVRIQSNYLKQLLQERYGIPYHKSWSTSLDAIDRSLKGMDRKEIESVITGLQEILIQDKVTKQQFLVWSEKIDRLRKEVEQG